MSISENEQKYTKEELKVQINNLKRIASKNRRMLLAYQMRYELSRDEEKKMYTSWKKEWYNCSFAIEDNWDYDKGE